MTKIEIESGIPIPGMRGRRPIRCYPFADLEVGQSFLATDRNVSQMSATACYFSNKTGGEYKFRCRTVEGGVRVWRVR